MRRVTASSSPACSKSFELKIGAEAYWQAWFDGAALPNPGKIGVGVILISPAGLRSEKAALTGCSGCSNEADRLSRQALGLPELAAKVSRRRRRPR
ncbi:MAG: hypothetical protein Q8O52_07845 [Sulfuritalea sp.]|nr:hypothetical protein [Sulfuritalea sp.]